MLPCGDTQDEVGEAFACAVILRISAKINQSELPGKGQKAMALEWSLKGNYVHIGRGC
jgi:hypothetical protein